MEEVKKYLSNTGVNSPFFLVVGDENYLSVRARLLELGLKIFRLSGCCLSPDKPPNLDRLFGAFDFADIDSSSEDKKIVVVGLGEYLALRGEDEAYKRLHEMKEQKVGNARIVLLLRGVSSVVRKIQENDKRRNTERYMLFTEETDSNISVSVIAQDLDCEAGEGIEGLICELEEGKTAVSVKTYADFSKSMFKISKINSAYDGIKKMAPDFSLAESLGSTVEWTEFLTALTAVNGEMSLLFDDFGDNPESELVKWLGGFAYKNWLYFIFLQLKRGEIDNSYLRYVLSITKKFENFKNNIVNAIINISHTEKQFDKFYDERSELISRLIAEKKIADSDIEDFVLNNRKDPVDGLFKLTAKTLVERKEFIALYACVDKNLITSRVNTVYNTLAYYLSKYTFSDPKVDGDLNELFTDYFERYKRQKVLNVIDDDFLALVEALAFERKYNRLRTRTEVIASVEDKENTYLHWIDALGAEFLGFIQKLCNVKELALKIHIAQANLPTITCENNGFFYDDWDDNRRKKVKELDELKHKKESKYNYDNEKLPVHLADELDIIESAIETIAKELKSGFYKKALVVSDHGASRLAVINGQEEKYDNDTNGEHGGRCSRRPDDFSPTSYDLPFATESPDGKYLVLANYGRFRGSRKANVEVHGGATLEEVVVPIIEITLANPETSVELVENELFASFRKPLVFSLFSKTELQNLRVVFENNPTVYFAKKVDKNHFEIVTDIKRSGKYEADVFEGDNPVATITLDVQSETRKSGDEFDNLFD